MDLDGQSEISDPLAGVVLIKGTLTIIGAAGTLSSDQLSQFAHLVHGVTLLLLTFLI